MPRPRDELAAGEWAVPALLAESSTHGFAIARVGGGAWRPARYRSAGATSRRRAESAAISSRE
jgi:hypothetical protein